MMKSFIFLLVLLQTSTNLFAADSLQVSSPDKKITVTVFYKEKISYTVKYNNELILQPSSIDLAVEGYKNLSTGIKIKSKKLESVDETITSPVPEKRKIIPNQYNQLSIQFAQPYTLLFRVYNDGVAYRIVTRFKDSIIINNEEAIFSFNAGKKILLPIVSTRTDVDHFHTSFEELYQLKNIDSLPSTSFAYSPVLVGTGNEIKIAITESDLEDYPGMFLGGTGTNAIKGSFCSLSIANKNDNRW